MLPNDTTRTHGLLLSSVAPFTTALTSDERSSTADHNEILSGDYHGQGLKLYGHVDYALPVFKILAPTITTILVIVVSVFLALLCRQMKKGTSVNSSVYHVLIAIAIADITTVASAMTELMYLFTSKSDDNVLPYRTCQTMLVLERLPVIPHTISIWLTVYLAFTRYICVSRPLEVRLVNKSKVTSHVIGVIVLISLGFYSCRFFDVKPEVVKIQTKNSETAITCVLTCAQWIQNCEIYETIFMLLRICLVQFVPCVILFILSLLLVKELLSSHKSLKSMSAARAKGTGVRYRISVYVLTVMVVMLVLELPVGILLCLRQIEILVNVSVIDDVVFKKTAIGLDLNVYCSYVIIFLIYCIMSSDFRSLITRRFNTCREKQMQTMISSESDVRI